MTSLIYLFAFASGSAALVYQVAWSRMLSMTFGSSTLAVSSVVAGFMGGMGLGAWLYHRIGDRVANALRAYAGLEIAIAVSTACFTLLYLQLSSWFAAVSGVVPAGLAMDALRVVSVFLLLLVPSAIMGATYPALCQVLIHTRDEVERRLGWIYGLNTLGAATGAVIAGFVLVESVGSTGAVGIANGINAAVGIGALLAARGHRRIRESGATTEPDEGIPSKLPNWITALVLFGSGFATLGYEIVWFRALHYILGPGTYVLSSALTIFLLGLGFGAVLYRPAMRFGRPESILGFSQLGVATLAILAIGAVQYILVTPSLYERLSAFSTTVYHYPWQWRVALASALALAIMLPATLWMGLAFPLASRLFLGSVKKLTARVGLAYLLSNLGSISGAIAAAMWILPSQGTVKGTQLLMVVNVGLGMLVLWKASETKVRAAAVAFALLPIALSWALPARLHFVPEGLSLERYPTDLVFEEESDLGTVQVFSRRNIEGALDMSIDGAHIGATRAFSTALYDKQLVLADLPMVLDRNIRHTLNLGLATGSTVKALAQYPWVETLDVVEINPAVVRAARLFPESAVLADPRAELIVEDAVHYLLRTDKRYDLIVNDAKQHPHVSGTSKVLSAELYRYALDRLSPCGLFAQFVPTGHSTYTMSIILRTFRSVFPELEVFLETPAMLIMVGSRCPIPGRDRPTREELAQGGAAVEIQETYFADPTQLTAMWVGSGKEIDTALGEGPINAWNRLPLEFASIRLSPYTSESTAATIDLVFAPRTRDPGGASPFGPSPYYEAMIQLDRGVQAWLRTDMTEARRLIRPLLKNGPDFPLLRKTIAVMKHMKSPLGRRRSP